MSYFNMVCDSCGREVYGCNIVNGMKFCAKCYQETFGETDKDKQIADLETKLAESEKKNFELVAKIKLKEHKPAFCTLADRDCEALGKIAELQKQLAEKDKEISEYIKIVDDLHKQLSDKCDFCDKTQDQDKILFAVEQLEKVKGKINDCPITDYDINKHFVKMYQSDAIRQIDNQIKAIKGEK